VDWKLVDSIDAQLAVYGKNLMERRIAAVEAFSSLFQDLYYRINGEDEVGLAYKPSWKTEDPLSHLLDTRQRDAAAGMTLSGPHRDKYTFVRKTVQQDSAPTALAATGEDYSERASTGQRRLLALLLRSAQAAFYSSKTGNQPVLLLDDVLLELDGQKRRRFLETMPSYEQAFFTFLPEEPVDQYKKGEALAFFVKNGYIYKQ
jgi:DNA replication and repair protein RecF